MTPCKIYLPVTMKLNDTYERIMDKLINISGYRSLYDNRIDKDKWLEYEDVEGDKVFFVIDSCFSTEELSYLKSKYRVEMVN